MGINLKGWAGLAAAVLIWIIKGKSNKPNPDVIREDQEFEKNDVNNKNKDERIKP